MNPPRTITCQWDNATATATLTFHQGGVVVGQCSFIGPSEDFLFRLINAGLLASSDVKWPIHDPRFAPSWPQAKGKP